MVTSLEWPLLKVYTRPDFTADGPLAVEDGRHPMLEETTGDDGSGVFVPNSTFLSTAFPFSVVTGPNMAGKSTYIRQVAVLVVLAHAGCYVPASFFSCPRVDGIYARIGTGDSFETSASTFMVEMREMQHILSNVTSDSIVIVDELGRATSSLDGEHVAWACAEALLRLDCKTLFATHADRLTGLANIYPGVRISTLAVRVSTTSDPPRESPQRVQGSNRNDGTARDARTLGLNYMYKLVDGACNVDHYGLRVAEMAQFPREILDAAWNIANALDEREYARRRAAGDGSVIQSGSTQLGGQSLTTVRMHADVHRRRAVSMIAQRVTMLCQRICTGQPTTARGAHVGKGDGRNLTNPGGDVERENAAMLHAIRQLQEQAKNMYGGRHARA